MGRRRRFTPPFEVEIESLGKKGVGLGVSPDGTPVAVKPAPPGSRILFAPQRKSKGRWAGRRIKMVRPPEGYTEPVCESFGLCGGCVLQELSLSAQRDAKWSYALRAIAEPLSLSLPALEQRVEVMPIRGLQDGFGYRNKVEFSFGVRRMLSQTAFEARENIAGRFLGFHASGRFDRIADSPKCWLIRDEANALLSTLRATTLVEGQPPLWDVKVNQGFWRHAMLRQGMATGELLVSLFTAPATQPEEVQAVEQVVAALQDTELPNGASLVGVVWFENSSVADVAQGTVRQVWGRDWLEEFLGDTSYHIRTRTFFQTSKEGAELLYDTIEEALEGASGTLYDLYCGIGSIGLYLSSHFSHIIGVEEVEDSIVQARENASRNGLASASFHNAKVEDVLELLEEEQDAPRTLVVDPPRAGLHPKVVRTLAHTPADCLVYVACEPSSLGRDAAILELGRWKMTKVWVVDLFPQTGHVEVVAQFLPKD